MEKQQYRKSLTNTKSIMEKHYKQKFEDNKRKIEEQFAEEILNNSSYNSSNLNDSLSCSIPGISERSETRYGSTSLLKQLNAVKQSNRHQKQVLNAP